MSFSTSTLSDNLLAPYFGAVKNHRPNTFIRWEEGEDEHGYNKYIAKYHRPNLPEKYRLDGEWGYHFNSLGYRGEEYLPLAKHHIFTCGCSYTYGMGIKWEQTFSYVFKEKYAEANGLALDDVNLLSFAQQGASNDYIARTVLTQCARVSPDLLLVLFTSKERAEYLDNNRVGVIGPWLKNEESENYYRLYSEEIGLVNTLKNILLVQQFCKLKKINYLFSLFHYAELSNPQFNEHPVIMAFLSQIDWQYFCPFSLIDYRCDVGRQGHHPGPLSNLRFGRKLFLFYKALGQPNVA